MKIFIGEVPENPYRSNPPSAQDKDYESGQQSILSQMVEVDLERIRLDLSQKIADQRFVGTNCVYSISDTARRREDDKLADVCIDFFESYLESKLGGSKCNQINQPQKQSQ